jgi:hypothetical protein
MFAWSSNEPWGGWPYSLEIAVVDAVAARVSLKIACARGPHFTGRCVSPAKALVANTIAPERGTPYDNHGGAARRRRSPGPSARVGVGETRTPERSFNTMAGSLGDARGVSRSRARIITSADETRRIEPDDHNPQPEGPGHLCG